MDFDNNNVAPEVSAADGGVGESWETATAVPLKAGESPAGLDHMGETPMPHDPQAHGQDAHATQPDGLEARATRPDAHATQAGALGEHALPSEAKADDAAASGGGAAEKNVVGATTEAKAPPALDAAFETKEGGGPSYWFEESSGEFWLRNDAQDWISLGTAGFARELKKRGYRASNAPKEVMTPLEERLREIEQNQRVEMAGIFAGWPQGFRVISGRRCLVTKELPKIVPVRGEWPVLKAFFEGLFIGEEPSHDEKAPPVRVDQLPFFYGWLQHTMRCYQENIIAQGLVMCMAGEPNCGKSRLAMILRWLLGERVAKPYAYMIGRDNFNQDSFEAVLHLVDDETADTSLTARLKFSAEMKKSTANDEVQQRGMHKNGFAVNVLRRLVVLVNLEANRLLVLPPMDDDIAGKVHLFKGYGRPEPEKPISEDTPWEEACWPMPMPTRTPAEQAAFRERLQAELPAFLWWLLNEFKMPSHVSGGRFGARHYHHPQILERLSQFSPHIRTWQLIESSKVVFQTLTHGDNGGPAVWQDREEWKGTARELYDLLTSEASHLTQQDKRTVATPEWLSQRLEACSKAFGEEVCCKKRTASKRNWILHRKEGLCD